MPRKKLTKRRKDQSIIGRRTLNFNLIFKFQAVQKVLLRTVSRGTGTYIQLLLSVLFDRRIRAGKQPEC